VATYLCGGPACEDALLRERASVFSTKVGPVEDRFTFAHQQRMWAKFPTAPRGKFRDKPRQYLLFLCQALGLLAVAAEATG
jgi:hypothetical protein